MVVLPILLGGVSAAAQSATEVEVYAEGLVNPKGLAFGEDGTLYVAESGAPGDVMVPLPANFGGEGPIGTGGRISRIPPGGEREDFVTGLPNIGLYSGVEMLGAGSLAVLDGQLWEVSAGHMTVSPALSIVNPDGTLDPVADVGAFNDAHPPPASNGDAVPMGNPYDLVALGGNLYITDGNYNRVLEATPEGELDILAAWENSPVTVGAAAGPDGALYVCQFSPAPYTEGTGRIDRVWPDGTVEEGVFGNLTTPIDVAFAPDGTPYVLQYAAEFSAELLRYMPFGGAVLRVNTDGTTSPVVTNLVFPTSMTFGPDGALYVSNYGNESNDGQGQVLRIVPGEVSTPGPDVPPPSEEGAYAAPTSQPIPTPDGSVEIAAEIAIVEPSDPMAWGYDPVEVVILAGQAVTFTNNGQVAHTATDQTGVFDTGLLKGGEAVTLVIDTPGRYSYICQPHPWMIGTLVVEGQPSEGGDAAGIAFDDLSPPAVRVWQVALFVGALVLGVVGIGLLTRSRNRQPVSAAEIPVSDGQDD